MTMKIFITTKRNLKRLVSANAHKCIFSIVPLLLHSVWLFCFSFFTGHFIRLYTTDALCRYIYCLQPICTCPLPTLSISGTMRMIGGPTLDHHLLGIIWVEDHFSSSSGTDMLNTEELISLTRIVMFQQKFQPYYLT